MDRRSRRVIPPPSAGETVIFNPGMLTSCDVEALEKSKQAAKTAKRRAALRQTITAESVPRQCLQVQETWVFDHLATYEYAAATKISQRAELLAEEQWRRPILP